MSEDSGADGAPMAWRPKQLYHTDSNISAKSISVVGTHPLGTLQVHQPLDSPMTEGPPPLEDDEDSAAEALVHREGGGDVVLVLDLPEVFTTGYDSVSFTAKHFGGVRDVPSGPHLFWFAHPSGGSARCGFWLFSSGKDQVHVMQWDKFNEVLGEAPRSEAHIQTENLSSFHSKLISYRDPTERSNAPGDLDASRAAANLKIWEQLTGSITREALVRISGQNSDGYFVDTGDRVNGAILMAAELELERRISNPLLQSRELKFCFDQHGKTYSMTQIGSARTLEATDSTTHILSLIDNPSNNLTEDDIVGELQFSYITGVHLGNDSCIQQWWYMILKLILKAYTLPATRPDLASALIRTITAQLIYGKEHLETSVLDQADSKSRELRLSLIIYKRRLEETLASLGKTATPEQITVGNAFSRLESTLTDLGWDISADYLRKGKVMMEDGEEVEVEVSDLQAEDERGEWAPEIVELDEHGRQKDLVSWAD